MCDIRLGFLIHKCVNVHIHFVYVLGLFISANFSAAHSLFRRCSRILFEPNAHGKRMRSNKVQYDVKNETKVTTEISIILISNVSSKPKSNNTKYCLVCLFPLEYTGLISIIYCFYLSFFNIFISLPSAGWENDFTFLSLYFFDKDTSRIFWELFCCCIYSLEKAVVVIKVLKGKLKMAFLL